MSFTAVLAGNPNAGKTTLFNALTKSRLKTGNFHGVTTTPAKKQVDGIVYLDVPGMYSLNSYTMEEVSAAEEVKRANLIVNVVDALTLESSLNLTKKLISLNPHTVVYVTKTALLKKRGGRVDVSLLSKWLGAPVFCCPPGELKNIISSISEHGFDIGVEKDGKITLDKAYYGGNSNLSRAERLFYNKFFALSFFVFSLVFTFFITFYPNMPGALLKGLFSYVLQEKPAAWAAGVIQNEQLKSFVCEALIGGVGGVLSFIPQIALLYAVLILLEESGITSALTFVTDGLFEKFSLSGRAAFSLISGFGCTAAAIATTRGYSEDSARRRTVSVLPFVPCGAKTPVFLTLLSPIFKNPFPAVCALYFSGLALAVAVSAISAAIEKKKGGVREQLISEITPIGLPEIKQPFKKLCFQVKEFIIKVATFVLVFCVISWLFSHLNFNGFCSPQQSFAGGISRVLVYSFYPIGITDWRIAYAALTGFAAKENVAATIQLLIPEGLSLSLASSVSLCVFFIACPACVSAFAASVREIGLKKTLKYNLLQLALAFALACATYFLLYLI